MERRGRAPAVNCSAPPVDLGEIAKQEAAKRFLGASQRSFAFYNDASATVMLVLAEEDFELEREDKVKLGGDFFGGAALGCVSKATRNALQPTRQIVRSGDSVQVPVSTRRHTYLKVFSKHASSPPSASWEDAALVLHYERVLDEHQREQFFNPQRLEQQLGFTPAKKHNQAAPARERGRGGRGGGGARGGGGGGRAGGGGVRGGDAARGASPLPPRPLRRLETSDVLPSGAESSRDLAHQSLESVVNLQAGEHALVKRSNGSWTYARFLGWQLAGGNAEAPLPGPPVMVFKVEQDGTIKAFSLNGELTRNVRAAKTFYL